MQLKIFDVQNIRATMLSQPTGEVRHRIDELVGHM